MPPIPRYHIYLSLWSGVACFVVPVSSLLLLFCSQHVTDRVTCDRRCSRSMAARLRCRSGHRIGIKFMGQCNQNALEDVRVPIPFRSPRSRCSIGSFPSLGTSLTHVLVPFALCSNFAVATRSAACDGNIGRQTDRRICGLFATPVLPLEIRCDSLVRYCVDFVSLPSVPF